MSEVFSCLVIPRAVDQVRALFEDGSLSDLPLAFERVEPTLTLIHHPGRRDDVRFASQVDRLAVELSGRLEPALAIDYDSRSGYRAARLFMCGSLASSFGAADEIWIQLGQDGYPLPDGPRLAMAELQDDQEYETIENAIELGLQALGQGDWDKIHEILSAF
jgi:hypothetical protein